MFSALQANLLEQGFASFSLAETRSLQQLRERLLANANRFVEKQSISLESIHEHLPIETLNELRLQSCALINQCADFRTALSQNMAPILTFLLGPEIAAQKNINLVISLPEDHGSQIPLHSDTWNGNSPFELNLWIPLTTVQKTQSMFILPLPHWKKKRVALNRSTSTVQHLMRQWESDLQYIQLVPGKALLFWNHLPHGNTVNRENCTRWSINMRFKNLFTPYGDKGLGDYFMPWLYSPVTEMMLQQGFL